eukprot:623399-Rhodomonas_salina.1
MAYDATRFAGLTHLGLGCNGLDAGRVLSAYMRAMRCAVLTQRMVQSAYAFATRCPVLTKRMWYQLRLAALLSPPESLCPLVARPQPQQPRSALRLPMPCPLLTYCTMLRYLPTS